MCGVKKVTYRPIAENHAIYKKVYAIYKQIHDAFGPGSMANVMKELLSIKDLCSKN
jgi:L-ribulokinase